MEIRKVYVRNLAPLVVRENESSRYISWSSYTTIVEVIYVNPVDCTRYVFKPSLVLSQVISNIGDILMNVHPWTASFTLLRGRYDAPRKHVTLRTSLNVIMDKHVDTEFSFWCIWSYKSCKEDRDPKAYFSQLYQKIICSWILLTNNSGICSNPCTRFVKYQIWFTNPVGKRAISKADEVSLREGDIACIPVRTVLVTFNSCKRFRGAVHA